MLFALVVRMVPDRDQASDAVQEAFFSAYRNMAGFRGGSVKSWLSRIAINAAMDAQRLKKRRPADPYPELEDDTWQPPADASADPVTTLADLRAPSRPQRTRSRRSPTTSGRRSSCTTSRATTTPRSPR